MIGHLKNSRHRAIGRYDVHAIFINMSYRRRGSDPRTHRNTIHTTRVFTITIEDPPRKRRQVSIDRKMMFAYSEINSRENSPPLYSVLKPDTSSLSPSLKSYGLRFVSARIVLVHTITSGGNNVPNHIDDCISVNIMSLTEHVRYTIPNAKMISTTS